MFVSKLRQVNYTMAIEVFSEISSPRISFSHNLNDAEAIEEHHHHHHHHQSLDTSPLDSDFSFGNNSFVLECLSAADELFSNGKILPIQIKKDPVDVVEKQVHRRPEPVPSPPPPPPTPQTATDNATKKRLKEFLSMSMDADDDKPALKSFWQFKRCTSLNSESSTRSKSLIRSLQFLSRSNSTGSAPNPKPTMVSKEIRKQPSLSRKSSPVSSSSSTSGAFYNTYSSHSAQKPPCGGYGNGVRVGSVLNLPHPLICNASLFGSRLCNGKAKRKKT